jgi:hypothetical protein
MRLARVLLLFSVLGMFVGLPLVGFANQPEGGEKPIAEKKWYERLNLRGYAQFRYNRLLETNPELRCDQCDKSWGNNGHFFIRRARLILSGDVHEQVFAYIQPDLANEVAGVGTHFLQIRDLYFDLSIDRAKEFRFRIGQSKVPFGFADLQSSQNRITLDRDDGLNSAFPNERDLGVFFYWAPSEIRARFKLLVDDGLKGSGDYGVVGVGVYNGQTANKLELGNNLHAVARVSYPFQLGNGQYIEPGVQAYAGQYTIAGTGEFPDRRAAASLVVYPQPIGFQAEYNFGEGPTYIPGLNTVETGPLQGGYVQTMFRIADLGGHVLIPYARYQFYDGGKKAERDARAYRVRELAVGVEWSPFKVFELTAEYTISSRRFEDSAVPSNLQEGSLLRLQAQFNF